MSNSRYNHIDNIELEQLLAAGAVIVDVRRQEEWQQVGIVAGSHLLTFFTADGNSQPEEWVRKLDELVLPEQQLVLIWRTGVRTRAVCAYLLEVTSRPQIYNVTAGIFGWLAADYPVVTVADNDE